MHVFDELAPFEDFELEVARALCPVGTVLREERYYSRGYRTIELPRRNLWGALVVETRALDAPFAVFRLFIHSDLLSTRHAMAR